MTKFVSCDVMFELSQLENNLFLLIFLATMIHSFYLCTLLLLKSLKEKELFWLGVMMLPVTLLLFKYLLHVGNLLPSFPHLTGVFDPLFYLMGPAFFFFVRKSVKIDYRLRWFDLFHLVPFVYTLWQFWSLYLLPLDNKLALIQNTYLPFSEWLISPLNGNGRDMLLLLYGFISFIWLKNSFSSSNVNKERLEWLFKFITVFIGIVLIKFLIMLNIWFFDWRTTGIEYLFVLLIALTIHVLGYVVLGKDNVLPLLLKPAEQSKYSKSVLNQEQIDLLQKEIILFLETKRPWIKSTFSIRDLSTAMGHPQHHISQVLNMGIGKKFFDLICTYRIAEVKLRLESGEASKYSLQGIATECGFKSKSSFNRSFKKETGMTPSDYLKLLNKP